MLDGCFVNLEVLLEFSVGDTELVLLVIQEPLQHVDVLIQPLPLLVHIEVPSGMHLHSILPSCLLDLVIQDIQIDLQLLHLLCILLGFRDIPQSLLEPLDPVHDLLDHFVDVLVLFVQLGVDFSLYLSFSLYWNR